MIPSQSRQATIAETPKEWRAFANRSFFNHNFESVGGLAKRVRDEFFQSGKICFSGNPTGRTIDGCATSWVEALGKIWRTNVDRRCTGARLPTMSAFGVLKRTLENFFLCRLRLIL